MNDLSVLAAAGHRNDTEQARQAALVSARVDVIAGLFAATGFAAAWDRANINARDTRLAVTGTRPTFARQAAARAAGYVTGLRETAALLTSSGLNELNAALNRSEGIPPGPAPTPVTSQALQALLVDSCAAHARVLVNATYYRLANQCKDSNRPSKTSIYAIWVLGVLSGIMEAVTVLTGAPETLVQEAFATCTSTLTYPTAREALSVLPLNRGVSFMHLNPPARL